MIIAACIKGDDGRLFASRKHQSAIVKYLLEMDSEFAREVNQSRKAKFENLKMVWDNGHFRNVEDRFDVIKIGFIDEYGVFYARKEALVEAVRCGQIENVCDKTELEHFDISFSVDDILRAMMLANSINENIIRKIGNKEFGVR